MTGFGLVARLVSLRVQTPGTNKWHSEIFVLWSQMNNGTDRKNTQGACEQAGLRGEFSAPGELLYQRTNPNN